MKMCYNRNWHFLLSLSDVDKHHIEEAEYQPKGGLRYGTGFTISFKGTDVSYSIRA